MLLWLDDVRVPPSSQWTWVKNYYEAIKALQSDKVISFASLDHDLADEHYDPETWEDENYPYHEKTGYDVICWMEENNVWPVNGVRCHSMNPVGRRRINTVIERHYGKLFL